MIQSLLDFAANNGLLGIAIIFTAGMLIGVTIMFVMYQGRED